MKSQKCVWHSTAHDPWNVHIHLIGTPRAEVFFLVIFFFTGLPATGTIITLLAFDVHGSTGMNALTLHMDASSFWEEFIFCLNVVIIKNESIL